MSYLHPAAHTALTLTSTLSTTASILTDPSDPLFKASLIRWTDANLGTPSAIFKSGAKDDITRIVKHAREHKIPFVPRSGGHSSWSTIAQKGWIINLSLLQDSSFDMEGREKTVTLQAGVLTKTLNEKLSSHGYCLLLPHAVGFSLETGFGFEDISRDLSSLQIKLTERTGSSLFNGLYGIASDSLLSAKVITASGSLVIACSTSNPDLFYALKGAGQFFGIVVSVTMRIYAIEHPVKSYTLLVPPSKVSQVGTALENLANGPDAKRSPGMAALLMLPGKKEPSIMVGITRFRPSAEIGEVMKPFLGLSPIPVIEKELEWKDMTTVTDGLPISQPGGLKSTVSCGLQKFSSEKFAASLTWLEEVIEKFPAAKGSLAIWTWSGTKNTQDESSAWSHGDVAVWDMNWISVAKEDKFSYDGAMEMAGQLVGQLQADQGEEDRALFPNHTRTAKLEQRYTGVERREKLREAKMKWDPEGVFTREFL